MNNFEKKILSNYKNNFFSFIEGQSTESFTTSQVEKKRITKDGEREGVGQSERK